MTIVQPSWYRGTGISIPYDPTPPAQLSIAGFPVIGGHGGSGSPAIGLDILGPVKFTVPGNPTPTSGYIARDLADPTGPIKVLDSNYGPVPNATIIPEGNQDDIIKPVKYKINNVGSIFNGYQVKNQFGSLYVADLAYAPVPNAVIVVPLIADVRRYQKFVLPSANSFVFTLPETPADPALVEAAYRGFNLVNGTHFTVTGTSIDFSPAGLNLSAGEEIDVYYEVPA